VGFVCSQPYRAHPAFRLTIETSIYVASDHAGSGIGSRLYDVLFAALADEALHRAVVGIALPNEASVRLHLRHGFTEVGRFDEYAIKNGKFVSSVWMQKVLPGASWAAGRDATVDRRR
jgi:phosphinothricin acetyltransferase